MKIKFNPKRIPAIFIYIQLIYVCIVRLLIDFGCPGSLTLVCDVINLVLFIFLIQKIGKTKQTIGRCKAISIFYFLIMIFGLFSAIAYGFNIILWIWSIRNFGRFFVFFIACCTFLEEKDFKKIKKVIIKLGAINWILAMLQFWVLGYRGDYIGGLFGTTGGVANTWLNSFLIVLICIQFSEFFVGECNFGKMILTLMGTISITVIAELKFLYIEMAIALIICIIATQKTKKILEKVIVILLGFVIVVLLSIPILYKLFPMFGNFFSFEMLYKTATGSYTGQGDLGRLTAIPTIITDIFNGNIFSSLFGIGMGNAEYSGEQTIFQSPFYLNYMYTNYFWFTDAVVMIQTGLVGVICYIGTFVSIIKSAWHHVKTNVHFSEIFLNCVSLAVLALLLFIYNIALNTESAYIIYIILSFGVIAKKKKTYEVEN